MINPRRGVPSASGLRRAAKCRGSFNRELAYPESQSKDATFGTNVAAAMAGTLKEADLTLAERQAFEKCIDAETRVFLEWLPFEPESRDVVITREIRLGLTTLDTVVEVTPTCRASIKFTGQYDFLVIHGKRGLLKDDKSLYGDIADAVDNEQIMGLAILAMLKHKLDHVTGVIVQPNVGKPTKMELQRDDLPDALSWLTGILDRSATADIKDVTPWTPDKEGADWCKYCKAKTDCAEWREAATQPLEIMEPMKHAHLDQKAMWGAMSSIAGRLSDAELIARWKGLAMAKAYPAVIEQEMKLRAANLPNFPYEERATHDQGNRQIEDVQKAWERVQHAGVSYDQFISCLKGVRIAELEEAIRVSSGVISKPDAKVTKYTLTAKQAKEKLNQLLGNVLTFKDAPLELVPVTAIEEERE